MKWRFAKPLESDNLISEFEEKVGYTFQKDFIDIVRQYNSGSPDVKCFYSFRDVRRKIRVFDRLLSFNKTDSCNIWSFNQFDGSDWDKFTNGEIRNFVIFAYDPFGDPIAFDKRTNEIVWIDHEQADFSMAVEKVADSFTDLLHCWIYDTDNPLLCYYASFKTIVFRAPTTDEKAELERLSGGRMPEAFRKAFKQTVLAEEPEVNYTGMKPYGIDRIITENTSPVGVKLRELGLFTFISSSLDENICFDMEDDQYPVYQLPRQLLNSDGDIEFTADIGNGKETFNFPFNRENALRFLPQLADSFDEFLNMLLDKDDGTYSVSDIIDRFEEGDIKANI